MKFYYSIFFLFLLVPIHGTSQYYNPINYSINNGLPSSEVYHIIQATDGYMWFATDRGISRFNGYTFESFNIGDGLTDNTVFHFYPLKNGTVWCTTLGNKLFSFNTNLNFREYPQNHLLEKSFKNDIISNMFLHKNNLYMSFNNKTGYIKISKDGTLINNTVKYKTKKIMIYEKTLNSGFTYSMDEECEPIFENSEVFTHRTDNANAIDIITIGKNTLVAEYKDVYLYKDSVPNILELNKYPLSAGKFDERLFWVGYRFGGYKVYTKNGEFVFSDLHGESVTGLCLDHEKGLWVSTLNSGVYYYKYSNVHPVFVQDSASNAVTDITFDDNNIIYVAYMDGNVMSRKNGKYSIIYKSHKRSTSKVQYYRSIGETIVNSDYVQFYLSKPDSNLFPSRTVIKYDDNPNHDPAFGSHHSFSVDLKSNNEISDFFRVNDITPYKNGYCLVSNHGIYYYNNKLKTTTKLYPNSNIRFEDIDLLNGKYYVGSMGYGVFIHTGDSLFSINKQDGLYSNMISEITVENDSILWVCTNQGLNRIVKKKNGTIKINGITQIDGLLSNETTDVNIVNDTVWVGTKRGLCYFPKKLLERQENCTPNYYLTFRKINVNDSSTDPKELTELDYTQNNIEFFFKAISYSNNPKLNYQYKLEGLDNNWHSTNQLSVRYPAIPPGYYTFHLKVYNKSFPNEINSLSLAIAISTPFYNSWWFYLIVIGLLSSIIYLFFKLYIFTYNKDVVRELLRHFLKRIKRKKKYFVIRAEGKYIRLHSSEIIYVKAAGNYLDIKTINGKYVIRCKISEFLSLVPDPIEFVQIHRSFIVRIDCIKKRNSKTITVDDIEIPITKAFKDVAETIQF